MSVSQFYNIGAGGGGGGAVTSVFSRTGVVSAMPDDYSELTALDVVTDFTVRTDSFVVDANGVAIGTATPSALGFPALQINGAFLCGVAFKIGGTDTASILNLATGLTIGSNDDRTIKLATDGVTRMTLGGTDGGVEFFTGVEMGPTTFVFDKDHFPTPAAGVITLPAGSTWVILADIDLGTDKLVCTGQATILGLGAETASLSATLGAAEYMIDTTTTLTLRNIELNAAGATNVRVDGSGSPGTAALDWTGVNFNSGRACEITDVDNCINMACSIFDDGYHVFGSIATLAFSESIMVPAVGMTGVKIDAAATVTRRLRIVDSVIVALGTGIDAPVAAFLTEGFVMHLVDLSGPGTLITGTTYTDDDARWIECRGVINTSRVGILGMESNVTATTISTIDVFEKAAGTTVLNAASQRFTMPVNNRLTYTAALSATFRVVVTASVTSSNNQLIALLARLNGVTDVTPRAHSTTNTGGRAEGIVYQGVVTLDTNDYIEVFVANETSTADITIEDMSVHIVQV